MKLIDNWIKGGLYYGVDKIKALRICGWIIYKILLLFNKHGYAPKYSRALSKIIFLEEKQRLLKMNKILIRSILKLLRYSNSFLWIKISKATSKFTANLNMLSLRRSIIERIINQKQKRTKETNLALMINN